MSQIEHGTKFDQGKPRFELIAPDAMHWLAKILTFGATKYEDNNWTGLKTKRILGALKRHMTALECGEDIDPESGMPHHAHLLCNAMFLTHVIENFPEQDDRLFTYIEKRKKQQTTIKKPKPKVKRKIKS